MTHRTIALLFIAAAFLSWPGTVQAATLSVSSGEVLVSHGAGYEAIRGSTDVFVGDTVFGKPGSTARIAFPDGCSVFLGVGVVFSVTAKSPCSDHRSASDVPRADGAGSQPAASEAGAEAAPGGDWNAATTTSPASDGYQSSAWPYVLGAAAIGGVVALTASGGSGNGTPASP
jgi:hypothetical protein